MAMESDVQLVENGETDVENAVVVSGNSVTVVGERSEGNESEDEDVDFNPFLKETLSEDASSSLSSEVEGLDTDAVNSHGGNATIHVVSSHGPPKRSSDGINGKRVSFLISEQGNGKGLDKEIGTNSEIDVAEDTAEAEMRMISSKNTPIIDFDDEDAICKRTRARHSLASCTLDELETFLQESDDDDDIPNVDEEEEYKKFLAAVLDGRNRDDQGQLEANYDDDDDEDNDADFEIEIEEALESDVDDGAVTPNKDEIANRRPETRQKGCKKANSQAKKRVAQQGKRPLRPILPIMPIASGACSNYLAPETSPQSPSYTQDLVSNGFQAHQIGQLYCLIYEHVQLLVQVYSLCVLDSSRQHIASQIKGLLSELVYKRDLVLAWRNQLYPTSCFHPAYTCSSISIQNKNVVHVEDSGESPNDGQDCRWLPVVGGSVLSVLDVAPLKLVGKYIDDVSNVLLVYFLWFLPFLAVREHQRRCVETTNIYLDKQPLFPRPICSSVGVDCNAAKGDVSSLNTSEISPNNKVPKKTWAATLVESTKKQSVALVPPQIAKLAQPFISLFNPALFPHKPPPLAVANRVLFMDSEDVLLAMGMMEYNNDWKAIQQRFLPCKSEHQGLKAFKLDWTSVWRTMVPYRDPNLLPRQWRTAIGTQKSYKSDSVKREKHRIYESNRRRSKAAAVECSHTVSERENESGEDCMDNDNEAYVHEAFLADWRPASSGPVTSKMTAANIDLPVTRSSDSPNTEDNHRIQGSEADRGRVCKVSAASEDSHIIHNNSLRPEMFSRYPPPTAASKPFAGSLFRSQRAGKPSISNLVKLAPELPPVKLPPAVRIISQASLRSNQAGSSNDVGSTGPGLETTYNDPSAFDCSANLVKPVQDNSKMSNPDSASLPSQKDGLLKDRALTERGPDLDPQMHPLLFRTMEGQFSQYPVNNSMSIPTFSFFPPMQHQMNVTLLQNPCTAGTNDCLKSLNSVESAPASSSLDFHPLLQRAKEFSANSLDAGFTGSLLNTDLELSRDQFVEDIICDAGATAAQMADATRPTSPSVDANDLDLDIHLSSASKRRKDSSHEGAELNPTVPLVNVTRVAECEKERSGMDCNLSQLADLQPSDLAARENMEISGPDESAAVSHTLDGINGASGSTRSTR
ncbi:Myb-like protein O [Bienertia sinuspersici]